MIDLLASWSIYMDYPLFRLHLQKYRDLFNKVILYPSDHNRETSYKDFLFENVKETWVDHKIDWFTDPPPDWRQEEAMAMLPYSDSEWVFFVEQDFFAKDWDRLYETVEKRMKTADVIGLWNPTNFPYIHPSFMFIKREILEKTNKDFRCHTGINGSDHFAMITHDAQKVGAKIVSLQDMGFNCTVTPEADCFHLGGLTSNYIDGILNPNFEFHRPEIFKVYNYFARKAPIVQSAVFKALSEQIELQLPEGNPEESPWKEFFM